jgi:hypothetical protein
VAIAGDTVAVAEALAFEDRTAGTVAVFEYAAPKWVGHQIASAAEAQLGWSLAAGEGVILAGAPELRILESRYHPGAEPGIGYAHFLTETSDGYTTERIYPIDGSVLDAYGYDVALDSDRLIVGAPHHLGSGAAFIHPLPWDESSEATCAAWDGTRLDLFGKSVAIDGNTIVVGARGVDDPINNSGAVYVFEAP